MGNKFIIPVAIILVGVLVFSGVFLSVKSKGITGAAVQQSCIYSWPQQAKIGNQIITCSENRPYCTIIDGYAKCCSKYGPYNDCVWADGCKDSDGGNNYPSYIGEADGLLYADPSKRISLYDQCISDTSKVMEYFCGAKSGSSGKNFVIEKPRNCPNQEVCRSTNVPVLIGSYSDASLKWVSAGKCTKWYCTGPSKCEDYTNEGKCNKRPGCKWWWTYVWHCIKEDSKIFRPSCSEYAYSQSACISNGCTVTY